MIDKDLYINKQEKYNNLLKKEFIEKAFYESIESDINTFNITGFFLSIFSYSVIKQEPKYRFQIDKQYISIYMSSIEPSIIFRIPLLYKLPFDLASISITEIPEKLLELASVKISSIDLKEKDFDLKEIAMYYRNFTAKNMSLEPVTIGFQCGIYLINIVNSKKIAHQSNLEKPTSFFKYLFKRDRSLAYRSILYQNRKEKINLTSLDGL